MTVTINFTTIFAWIGATSCALVALWLVGWLIRGIAGMGEFLGIWEAMGRGLRATGVWVKTKLGRQP